MRRLRFVYAGFSRHAEDHPELLDAVPCDEYFGPPSLGIASIAAVTPKEWSFDFRDDRMEEVGFDDELDLVAISCFTPSATRARRSSSASVRVGGFCSETCLPASRAAVACCS